MLKGVDSASEPPSASLQAALADGVALIKWMQSGFTSPPAGGGTTRNLMGFKDGTNNPSTRSGETMSQVVWVGDEGGWMKAGSYLVVRRIRIALEHWDKTELGFQEEVRRSEKMPLARPPCRRQLVGLGA